MDSCICKILESAKKSGVFQKINFAITCVQVLLFCKLNSFTAASVVCRDPPNLQERYRSLNNQLPATLARGIIQQSSYQVTICQSRYECPANFSSLPYRHTYSANSRSICPWYIKEDYSSSRFPNVMLLAQGTCANCVGLDRDCICEYIGITVWVLRRTSCVNGLYQYEPESMFLQLASVPTRQPINTQNENDFQ